MSKSNYSGRHRPVKTPSALPRFAGSGFLLPTAAAATLVLTATGAHLGTNTVNLASSTDLAQVAKAQSQSILTDRQESQDAKINALTTQARSVQDRAARDNERAALDAVAQENAKRAAQEQARKASQGVQQISAAPTGAPAVASKAWVPPISTGYALTSGFGMRWGALHPGQDFAVPVGTPVKAMSSGTVIFAGWSGGYGNKVEIEYWDGTVSWFAHNSSLKVTQGEKVSPGEIVSLSGNTGHSTGPHLHVEIHPNGGSPIPPIGWLKQKGIMP